MHRPHIHLMAAQALICMSAVAAEAGSIAAQTEATAAASAAIAGALEESEYGSMTLVINHLINDPQDSGVLNVEVVWSTQTADEALPAQANYFMTRGRANNLFDNIDAIGTAAHGLDHDVIYVYTPNVEQTQVIGDVALLGAMKRDPTINPSGTELGLHLALIEIATQAKRLARAEGKSEVLVTYVPNLGSFPA